MPADPTSLAAPRESTGPQDDLTACDREPIHIPGNIQSHGILLAMREPGLTVFCASANAPDLLGCPLDALLGATPEVVFGSAQGKLLRDDLGKPLPQQSPLYLRTLTVDGGGKVRSFHAVVHRFGGALILELEPTASQADVSFRDLYPLVGSFIAAVQGAHTVEEVCQVATREVRRITGFDRVLVYQFDAQWNGHVVAECGDEVLPSYLDLWFPAADIPRQVRELYLLNRIRLIVEADHTPVPLVGLVEEGPLDLSLATLRGVSPVHVEYMKNMGTAASMSIAVLREGELWGLISCHHKTPRVVPVEMRTACELLSQYLAQQVAAQERGTDLGHRIRLKAVQSELLAAMATEADFVDGLLRGPERLLRFVGAGGAAVLFDGTCHLIGDTPGEAEVRLLADWLAAGKHEVFHTDALSPLLPDATAGADSPSGLLALQISKLFHSYLMWFRPEVVRTVKWGGDPNKPVEAAGGGRLHPRASFEQWKETVCGRSLPWHPAEVAAATDLRQDIVGIVLRKAEEMAQLAGDLRRSNEELESFSYSVSHDLRAPFRHIVGYAELLHEREAGRCDETSRRYLDTILESGRYAGTLVDNLIGFAQMGRAALDLVPVDLASLVEEARRELAPECVGRVVGWKVGPLPPVRADLQSLRLVVRNLLDNAVKYTRTRPEAVIEVGGTREGRETVFYVRDNGVGFDMRYVGKLFGVFQRLHRVEDFEGTGIGLANTRRIIARHGGRTWAEGELGKGATFYFTLPRTEEDV